MWSNRKVALSNYCYPEVMRVSSLAYSATPPTPPKIMNRFHVLYPQQPTCTYYTYYDYLVVIDFEATCDANTRNENPRPMRNETPEIIQFPAILVNVRTMAVDGIFNSIVKPVEAPVLSDFCTDLTGITQGMVKKAPTFPTVIRRFEAWLKSHGIALNSQELGYSFAIVTDGSYDMGHFLYKQCLLSQLPYPVYATRWVNIRTIFTKVYRRRWVCLKAAMDYLGLPFEGQAHNGLDDSKNICKVLMQFLRAGCLVYQTERILLEVGDQEKNEMKILNDKSAGKYDLATVASITNKEPEHICVYATDCWSTQRCVPPQVDYGYHANQTNYHQKSGEALELSNESGPPSPDAEQMGNQQRRQPTTKATSGSCESIASGCSNKENSIPIYIPSNNKGVSGGGGIKSRTHNQGTQTGRSNNNSRTIYYDPKDVICVSAAGIGNESVGKKKRRNGHGRHHKSTNTTNSLETGVTDSKGLETELVKRGASAKFFEGGVEVAELVNGRRQDHLPRQYSHNSLQSESASDSDEASTTSAANLHSLVSDMIRTEE